MEETEDRRRIRYLAGIGIEEVDCFSENKYRMGSSYGTVWEGCTHPEQKRTIKSGSLIMKTPLRR